MPGTFGEMKGLPLPISGGVVSADHRHSFHTLLYVRSIL